MKRIGFITRIMAALGVGAFFNPVEAEVSVSELGSSPPAPPCPKCGGIGEIIVETLGHKGVITLAEGTGLPVPYGALYESHPCPRCSVYGKSVIEAEGLDELQRHKNRMFP